MRDLYLLLWVCPKDKKVQQDLVEYTKAILNCSTKPKGEQEPLEPLGPLGPKPSDYLKFIWKTKCHEVQQIKKKIKKEGVSYITAIDDLYPPQLKGSIYSPLVLSYRGEFQSYLNSNAVTLVGSRRLDPELELWITQSFKTRYDNYIYISGGAIGTDQSVHKACVRSHNKTLVVLPSGILEPYPSYIVSSMKGFDDVIFLSQFPPMAKVVKSNFYTRNYLMASLSDAVIVLQAEEKSGTLLTAKYALELNKELYVLCCSPWNKRYSGNVKLLNEGASHIINLDLFQ